MKLNCVKVISVAATLALGLFLAACGKKDIGGENGYREYEELLDDAVEYIAEFETYNAISDSSDEYFSDYRLEGGYLFYNSTKYSVDNDTYELQELNLYKKDLKTGEVEKTTVNGDKFPGMANVTNVRLLEDGSYCGVLCEYDYVTYKESYNLIKISKDGENAEIVNFENCFDDEDRYASSIIIDKDLNTYISTNATIYKFDKTGKKAGKIKCNDYVTNLAVTEAGNVYITKNGNMGIEIDKINEAFNNFEKIVDSNDWGYIYPADGDNLFYGNNNGLVYVNTETKEATKLFNWLDVDISTTQFSNIVYNSDGTYSVSYTDYRNNKFEVAKIRQLDPSEKIDKATIKVATSYVSQDFKYQVIEFNKKNNKVRISVEAVLQDDSMSYDDAMKLFKQNVAAGVYDIIDIGTMYDARDLYKSFMPLNDWAKETFPENEYYTNIFEAYTEDGNLYAIPSQFTIQTLALPTKIAKNLDSWTVKDLLNLRKEYRDIRFTSNNYKSASLYTALQGNLDKFIKDGKCDFDNDEFRSVLEFANTFEESTDWNEYNEWESVQSGETILINLYLYDVQSLQLYNALVDGGITIMGYPSENGGVHDISCQSALAISDSCKNVDLAKEFIKFCVDEQDFEYGSNGFCIQKAATDAIIKRSMEKQLDADGNEYPVSTWGNETMTVEIYAATEEEADMIRNLLGSARTSSFGDSGVMGIISEECEPYFNGAKSIDETIKVIQSRVGIYLAEKN